MSQYITADQVVKQALIETGSTTEHGYQYYLNLFFRGLKDLKLNAIRDIKTVCVPLNPNKSIDLPTDSLGWTRVGILTENNCIKELVQNPKMGLFQRKDKCGNDLPTICKCCDETNETSYIPFLNFGLQGYYWDSWGTSLGKRFGLVNPTAIGYFRENKETDQLFISTEIDVKEIYLEYISNGINETGETKIPVIAEEAILAYMQWKKILYSDKVSIGEKQLRQNNYGNEQRKLIMVLNKFTVTDLMFTLQKGYKLSPK